MFRPLSIAAVIILFLAGCATYPDVDRERLQRLPFHYVHFDAHLAWEVRGVDSKTVIDGEFRNVRYAYMDGVEVWVAALNTSGKTVARSAYFLTPRLLRQGDTVPFSLKLNIPPVPGTKLRFTYKYSGIEGAGTEGGDVGRWMQSFDAFIPK